MSIPNSAAETWMQAEGKTKRTISDGLDGGTIISFGIERAHRPGHFAGNKCTPIIVQFSLFKSKEQALGLRAKLKLSKIGVSENFSFATRWGGERKLSRRKLYSQAKL